MPFQPEDAAIFFADFALPVTGRGVSVEKGGILDRPETYVVEGEVIVTDWSLLVETAVFGALVMGDVVIVDGERFQVRSKPETLSDGLLTRVPLMKLRARALEATDTLEADQEIG